jgi:NodT family efflux transporter outer membrane factor (OMF) lipoprotein
MLAMLLAGCSATLPETPAVRPTPAAWSASATPLASVAADEWWRAFGDPALDELVASVPQSDDVAIAEARLDAAAARLRVARAALRPELGASARGSIQRIDDLELRQGTGVLSLAWSPDLNGAGRTRRRAAGARLEEEGARTAAVRQATRATVVRLYVTWREGLARAEAERRAVEALSGTERLVASRRRAGLVSGVDPVAAEATRASAAARRPAAIEAAETARLALEALLGRAPGALQRAASATVPAASPRDILLAPLDVLARRPDVLAAERALAATGFEAAAARRDFWPTITLGAAVGGQVSDPEFPGAFTGALGQLTGGLLAPLLSFGRLEAARDGADAARREAAIRYRQTATRAVSEVETALTAAREADVRRVTLAEALAANRRRAALSMSRYRAGLSPLLDVLVAREGEARAEADLATAQADTARAYIALSVAMGLGSA